MGLKDISGMLDEKIKKFSDCFKCLDLENVESLVDRLNTVCEKQERYEDVYEKLEDLVEQSDYFPTILDRACKEVIDSRVALLEHNNRLSDEVREIVRREAKEQVNKCLVDRALLLRRINVDVAKSFDKEIADR